MAEKTDLDAFDLDDLFQAAKDTAPAPSDDLMARIMADAAAVTAEKTAPAPAPSGGFLGGILEALGGWKPAAGLAMAGVTGIMVGFAAPTTLDSITSLSALTLGDTGVDELVPSFSDFLSEG